MAAASRAAGGVRADGAPDPGPLRRAEPESQRDRQRHIARLPGWRRMRAPSARRKVITRESTAIPRGHGPVDLPPIRGLYLCPPAQGALPY
jgi:hypothetical protein